MRRKFKILSFSLIFLFFLIAGKNNAQILRDTTSFRLTEKCIDDIYSFRFTEAKEKCRLLNLKYPGHPVIYLLDGLITYWKDYPLLPKSSSEKVYLYDMRTSIHLSDKKNAGEEEAEYLLINLCARGMLLQFYADIDEHSEVIPLATSTYPHIRQSFKYTSVYYDFYFFTGLYNYYREAYPEAYPVYKAFSFIFPRGNKADGIREMQIAGRRSILLKAESYSFLSWISTNFEHDYKTATHYSKVLYELYPENPEYLSGYIRNLLLMKQYEEAENLLNYRSKDVNLPFYLAVLEIFNGILQEKKYHDNNKAQQLYRKGIADFSAFSGYGNEYAAYAYFGLSRISESNGDKKSRKAYHKKAVDLAVFKNIDFDN
jgi:hypothetical protein